MLLRRNIESLPEILAGDGGRKDLFTSNLTHASAHHTTYRAQVDDDLQLPLVIQPANFDLEDFFVNVATYHQDRSPISAFVHVLDEQCSEYFERLSVSAREEVPLASGRRALGSLGAAVGETFLAALGSAESGGLPSYASCRRSLSFVLTRARVLYPLCRTEYVAQRWVTLRQMTGLSVSGSAVTAVSEVHSFLFGQNKELPLWVREFLAGGYAGPANEKSIERALVEVYPRVRPFVAELSGPFDARMKAFTQLVEQIHASSKGESVDGMAVGFFANRIQPGSFAHAKAIAKLVDHFPGALVWYGMFCGLSDEFSLGEFGAGLIAKLSRDARQPFSFDRRPACDLSLEELQVLMRLPPRAEIVKPSQQKIAVIALMPGVDIPSRYSIDDDQQPDSDRDRRSIESEEMSARLTMLLEDALGLVRRSRSSYRRPESSSSAKRTTRSKS